MKRVCQRHEQAYDLTEGCTYCNAPRPAPVEDLSGDLPTLERFDFNTADALLKRIYGDMYEESVE